ncbi:response regulator [Bradyrhizobium sp. JYMT SZCCT0180]|uniref:response regulator n=1 Tax=Bradyrhizobium sp. JYMT SZCCT0180 TaxID=2807666 RepID=UPI0032DF983D
MSALWGKRILVVEDEAIIAIMVEEMLIDLGASVVGPAQSIPIARNLVETESIDAAVLDVNIRSDRIDPIAELLRARRIPFVFATGYGASASSAKQDELILEKPYTSDRLLGALTIALGGRHSAVAK